MATTDERLLALRETRGAQTLLALQAGLVLRGCVPERGLEDVLAARGRAEEGGRSSRRSGLAGGDQVGGAHGTAPGGSVRCFPL